MYRFVLSALVVFAVPFSVGCGGKKENTVVEAAPEMTPEATKTYDEQMAADAAAQLKASPPGN